MGKGEWKGRGRGRKGRERLHHGCWGMDASVNDSSISEQPACGRFEAAGGNTEHLLRMQK